MKMKSLLVPVIGLTLMSTAFAARPVSFKTTEGTWMSLDVSPDGRTIVFDLLGDLYTLPIAGGAATRITQGSAYDTQPRWSPDGRSIAFSSDRSGSDNIWIASADGSNAQALTTDKDGGLTAPSWTPDGAYVLARKDPTYNRRGSAEVWLYSRQGGRGLRLTDRQAGGGLNPNGPVSSPDGRWVYFAHGFRVLDSTWVPWQIWRADRRSGDVSAVTTGFHGAVRPALSPDGNQLAYVRRDHAKSALVVRDLQTGVERDVLNGLDRDDQRGPTDYDGYPGFAFMPDGRSIVIANGGKIHRVSANASAPSDAVVPFTADVSLELADRSYVPQRITDDDITARIIRWASFTPDGRTVVFETLGKIWIAEAGAAPRRITADAHREYAPAISPDGRSVAYVSWDDRERGHLWKLALPSGKPERLTRVAREYANPSWSPDGSRITLTWRAPSVSQTANLTDDDPSHEILWIPSGGGETHMVTSVRPRNAGRWYPVPRFSADGARVYFVEASSETSNDLYSINLDGTDRRSLARFKYLEEAAPSPDGRHLAFVSMDDLYVTDLPPSGRDPIDVDLEHPTLPLRTMTRDGGGYLGWTADGKGLTWCYANVAYRQLLDSQKPEATPIRIVTPRALPSGNLLLHGARILTMKGDEVIENGDVLIARNRITGIGRAGSLRAPAGTTVLNVAGKTIMPGIVDVHWHGHYSGQEVFPQDKWQYLADLAYGVTSVREVSAPTRDMMAQADLVEAGDTVGPRIFGTGWPLFAARDGGSNQVVVVNSLDDARRHVRRLKRNGVTYLKQYLQPRREQRQWLQQAAREEGLMITAEGGGLKVQTTMMLDGYTGFEHGIPVAPIYNDLIQLLARSELFYTPTFVAGYAKPGAMDYYYRTINVHDDPRASRFMPHDLLDRLTTYRLILPYDQYLYRIAARNAYDVAKAGGHVAVGGHGNHPGLGPHWELWSYVEGGMPPLEALKAATLGGAEALGIQQDVGTIEAGKIADLIVLNADPRGDVHRTTDVFRVIKNGRVLDPEELATRIHP
jgi:Tol biopolymer transport system component/imidazolonepropionase-like amidohydrolase